jgi:hypothetical protein
MGREADDDRRAVASSSNTGSPGSGAKQRAEPDPDFELYDTPSEYLLRPRLGVNTKLHGNAYVGNPTYRIEARWDTRRRANAANADRAQIHDFPKTDK